jgi:hypothetical protein
MIFTLICSQWLHQNLIFRGNHNIIPRCRYHTIGVAPASIFGVGQSDSEDIIFKGVIDLLCKLTGLHSRRKHRDIMP